MHLREPLPVAMQVAAVPLNVCQACPRAGLTLVSLCDVSMVHVLVSAPAVSQSGAVFS